MEKYHFELLEGQKDEWDSVNEILVKQGLDKDVSKPVGEEVLIANADHTKTALSAGKNNEEVESGESDKTDHGQMDMRKIPYNVFGY